MAYSFSTTTWTIAGEYNFGDFTLLNPTITPTTLNINGDNLHLVCVCNENGGVYDHRVHLNHTITTQTDINLLVDEIILTAYPTATTVA